MMALDKQARAIQKLSTSDRLNLQKKEAVQREFSRLHACTIVNFLLGALVSTAVLAAQEPPKNTTSESGTVLRQTVRRVRVDVVVTDPQGHTIRDLHASDFHVSEDGEPQTIRQFEYHTDEDVEAALPKRPALPPHTFMNMPAAPERGPLMVVLYDVLNTQVADQLSARAQMLKFLQKSAGRRIAIFFLGDRLRLLQGFTSDTDLLVQAVNQTGASSLRGYQAELTGYPTTETNFAGTPPGGSGGRMTDAQAFEKRSADMAENARQAEASQLLTDRVETTLTALGEIGRFLEGLPGRKNLIWYSGSFPAYISSNPTRQYASIQPGSLVRDDSARNYTERIRKVINLLNTAEVAIYPVDARGLLTDYPPSEIKTAEFATMNLLGDQTGGKAFYSTNALEEALESAADDGSSYYSLVYAPTNGKFNGSVRRISVRLGRGQYHLAYRRSYIADDVASTPPEAERGRSRFCLPGSDTGLSRFDGGRLAVWRAAFASTHLRGSRGCHWSACSGNSGPDGRACALSGTSRQGRAQEVRSGVHPGFNAAVCDRICGAGQSTGYSKVRKRRLPYGSFDGGVSLQ